MSATSGQQAGYEIGASRPLAFRLEVVWEYLTSPAGLEIWLGPGAQLIGGDGTPEPGTAYLTADGIGGVVEVYEVLDRIRVTWRPPDWAHDSTVEVTLQDTNGRTLLGFHHEHLADAPERARQREYWKRVLEAVEAGLRS